MAAVTLTLLDLDPAACRIRSFHPDLDPEAFPIRFYHPGLDPAAFPIRSWRKFPRPAAVIPDYLFSQFRARNDVAGSKFFCASFLGRER